MEKLKGPVISLILLLLIVWVGVNIAGSLTGLIINSIIGLAILILLNLVPGINVKISIWSVLIVAFGGIPGIILVLLLHYAGIEL